jgi:hypothetical protein
LCLLGGAFEGGKIFSVILRIDLSIVLSSSYPRIICITEINSLEGIGKMETQKRKLISRRMALNGRNWVNRVFTSMGYWDLNLRAKVSSFNGVESLRSMSILKISIELIGKFTIEPSKDNTAHQEGL